MTPQPEIRIGDAEREAAVSALGEHYAAGRLTKEEYDERAGIAWTAKTNSVLWPLFADLPRPQNERRRFGIGLAPVLMLVLAVAMFHHHGGLLILLGIFWVLWAKTAYHARHQQGPRRWDVSRRR
jgi:hypothetical protein